MKFGIRTILVLTTVIGFLCFAIPQTREAALRSNTENHFKQVGLAILRHASARMQIPAPIKYSDYEASIDELEASEMPKPLFSWRFSVVNFMASYKTDFDRNASWRAPKNSPWLHMPQEFSYTGWDHGPAVDSLAVNTCIFAITGPGTAFGESEKAEPKSIEDIPHDTILAAEIRDSGCHWMKPGDFDIRTMPRTINAPGGKGISSRHKTGFHVIFADAAVWYIGNDVPFTELEKFFTTDGAAKHDRDQVLGPYRIE